MFLPSALVILTFFSSQGWQSWDLEYRPLIPEGMPVLVDDDLRLEDGPAGGDGEPLAARAPGERGSGTKFVGELREGVKEWAEFLAGHGVGLFDSRERLKSGLSRYAEHRAAGPVTVRFAATTWGQHMSILSLFYRWPSRGAMRRPSRLPTARRG